MNLGDNERPQIDLTEELEYLNESMQAGLNWAKGFDEMNRNSDATGVIRKNVDDTEQALRAVLLAYAQTFSLVGQATAYAAGVSGKANS